MGSPLLNSIVTATFLSLIALSMTQGASSSSPAAVPPQAKVDLDVFGIGINFDEICDLHAGAAIGDKCYGFIGAVTEIVMTNQLLGPQFRQGPKTCIPKGQTVSQIFEKIRPLLRVRVCSGFCTQTGYVISSLHEAYPCAN